MGSESLNNNSGIGWSQSAGDADTVSGQHADAASIQAWLISRLAEALKVAASEIDGREPFANYGMNSMTAVSLSGDLEDWLGRTISPTIMWDYPTINALAEHLAATSDSTETVSK